MQSWGQGQVGQQADWLRHAVLGMAEVGHAGIDSVSMWPSVVGWLCWERALELLPRPVLPGLPAPCCDPVASRGRRVTPAGV